VFKSKKQFREFIGFIKKGGKLKWIKLYFHAIEN
jgi:hypothetical protein